MKFSVLIPAYKTEFFEECLKSVLGQTYADFEVVVVDDCSPHDIKSIAERFDDPRLSYHRNRENYGALRLVENWNNALALVSGEYVICIGDDDRLLPNCLSDLAQAIATHPDHDLFHTRMEVIDENGVVIDLQPDRPDYENFYAITYHWLCGRRQYLGEWVFRTDTLRARGGFFDTPCAWAADDYSAILAAERTGVRNLHTPAFQYRLSSLSITKSRDYSLPKIQAWNRVEQDLRQRLQTPADDPVDELQRQLALQRLPRFFRSGKLTEIRKDMYAGTGVAALFRWLRRCRSVGISRKHVLATFAFRYVESFKNKF